MFCTPFQSRQLLVSGCKAPDFARIKTSRTFVVCLKNIYLLNAKYLIGVTSTGCYISTQCHTIYIRISVLPWASYQIRKIAGCACAGNAGNVFPRRRFQRKLLVSDPGMHHGTCVTHVPWCMSGSLTCGDGENVPGIPGACAPAILRIWQEAHGWVAVYLFLKGTQRHLGDAGMLFLCLHFHNWCIHYFGVSDLERMSQDIADEKSILIEVMAY